MKQQEGRAGRERQKHEENGNLPIYERGKKGEW